MKGKNYTIFTWRTILVCCFLLLNGIVTAAPLLQHSFENSHVTGSAQIPAQNNGNDLEENCRLNDVSAIRQDQRQTQRFATRHFNYSDIQLPKYFVENYYKENFSQKSVWIKPLYYSFLSIYHLF